MPQKPTYGELIQKINELENKIALKESEEPFRSLYDGFPLATFTWRKKGDDFELIQFNKAAMVITNGEAHNYIGKTARELYTARDHILHDFHHCFAEKKVITREITSRHFLPEKSIIASFSFIPPEFILVCIEDITERKRAEEALRQQNIFLETLMETLPMPIFYKDTAGRYTGCNRAFEEIVGRSREEIIGKSVYDMAPKDIADKYAEKDEELFKQPVHQHYEWRVQDAAGRLRDVIFDKACIFGEKRQVKGLIGVITDITERRLAENALKESRKKYQNIIEKSDDIIWTADLNLRTTYVSSSIEKKLGFTPEERMAQTLDAQLTPSSYKAVIDLITQEVKREKDENADPNRIVRIEVEYFHKNGSTLWFEVIASGLRDENGSLIGIQAISRDISERKRVQEQLQASEENYRNLVNNLPLGITVISPEMKVLTLNSDMKQKFPEIDVSKQPICYQSFFNPPRDGVCPDCPVVKTFQDGNMYETVQNASAGDEMRHVRLISSPMKDHEGKVTAAIQMVEDITERIIAEEYIQTLSAQILTTQENERQMISRELHDSVAQDLSSIKIALEILFNKQSIIPDETRRKISELSQMVQRSISTVRNLAYDLRPPELKELGLIRTLTTYCEEFVRNTGINVKFQSAGIQKEMLDSFVDINLYRLFQESLNNVRKHAEARQVIIRLVAAYPNIILRIEDDGKGFDVNARKGASDHATRIGLDSMKERVTLLRGKMTVQSYPMKGTKIIIKFPITEKTRESEKANSHYR